MRTSAIVITPVFLMFAPVVLLLAASFTTLAIITSVFALAVIWIRLGFLVVEFSGGVTLDFVAWGMQKWVDNKPAPPQKHPQFTRIRPAVKAMDPYAEYNNNVRPARRHSRHLSTSRKLSAQHRAPKRKDVWNAEFVSAGDFINSKEGITKDYYHSHLVPNLVEPKRPLGRRSRSQDYLY